MTFKYFFFWKYLLLYVAFLIIWVFWLLNYLTVYHLTLNQSLSTNKTISISILKPIDPGLNKEEFLNLLENNIYSELDKIN